MGIEYTRTCDRCMKKEVDKSEFHPAWKTLQLEQMAMGSISKKLMTFPWIVIICPSCVKDLCQWVSRGAHP
jgi:hypothetical protein